MSIRALLLTYYKAEFGSQESKIVDPSWEEIEGSLRALDQFSRPYVWMYTEAEFDDSSVPDLEVMGGNGRYVIASKGVFYTDERGGMELVPVWTSDQGAEFPGRYICGEIDEVLRIVEYFNRHGTLDPSCKWTP